MFFMSFSMKCGVNCLTLQSKFNKYIMAERKISNIPSGLTAEEVLRSRAAHGDNVLTPPHKVSLWRLYLEKYKDPIIQILLVAAAISLVLAFVEKDFIETAGIFVAIFLATTIGFYFERDAAKKFNILTALDEEQPVKVYRRGKNEAPNKDEETLSSLQQIPRCDLVVGDVVLIETGDEIPADGELLQSIDLQVNESTLTGEMVTTKEVRRNEDATPPSTLDCEEHAYPSWQMLRSTMVMSGRGIFRVTAVGDATEIGKVAQNSSKQTDIKTPLNLQLSRLAKMISKIGAGISIAAFLLFLLQDILTNDAVWQSGNYLKMAEVVLKYFMMAVTLIVMAVPEGLPMAVTLSLALNMRRMLKSNNLVRKLHACETMGAVTVICTDKTGTLTQNKMTVVEVYQGHEAKEDATKKLCEAIALNTTAELDGENGIGNPTETALLIWTQKQGHDYRKTRNMATIISQQPFSTETKYMETTVSFDGNTFTFLKGAPEIVISKCNMLPNEQKEVEEILTGYQKKAMRTLAFACNGQFQAVVGISDPIRADVPDAVEQCRQAGIEVKIVTGDTSATAIEIARQIGIWPESINDTDSSAYHISGSAFSALPEEEALAIVKDLRVISRARPQDKQRLVQLLQKQGEVVAVTGDGTNDAPALHHAHVGLSLGSSTSVAKEASDMTLLDDSFHSIAHAVMWGRSLYRNIQRFLFFQLVVNVTALLLVLGGSIIGTEMPLTVTQILWVNLIMDTFAAMALASLPPSREVMKDKPRNQSDFIITKSMWQGILGIGVSFFILLFALLVYLLKFDKEPGILLHDLSLFFTVFVMLQFWNLFNAKSMGSMHSAFRYLYRDHGLLLVLLIILIGQILIVTFGGKMFRTVPLSLQEWTLIIIFTSLVMWIGEGWRLLKRISKK